MASVGERFEELVAIMHRLRAPGGCPWDAEQTHASIKPYLIEEAYEVVEAIEAGDDRELCGELGDLLLQVIFHAEMASENDRFTISDVILAICEKMERRHPHVFGDVSVSDAAEVKRNWSRIKREERRDKTDSSALAGVPKAMPALLRAHRIGEKASNAGFDWHDTTGVIEKVREELGELQSAIDKGDRQNAEEELGDLLFAATSLARHLGIRSEDALKQATDRFSRRYRHMEHYLAEQSRDLHELSDAEKDELWETAKHSSGTNG
jgi:tetrapyrrole methylase family protein/MazG family protein